MTRAPVIALSHGGGPMPILGDPMHKEIIHSLKTRVPELLRLGTDAAPRAIVLVTAHWRTETPVISSNENHELYYDYSNFPPEAYNLNYPAPGSPSVAEEVFNAFSDEGLSPEKDSERGWDHGVFIPMLLVNPKADVPVVQVSVLASEDPAKHWAMGKALSKLRDSNIAIVGSGFASFHNTRLWHTVGLDDPGLQKKNVEWSKAVTDASTTKNLEDRATKFANWRNWPFGREMHPFPVGGDHFMPLIVCAGAGGNEGAEFYKDAMKGIDMYSYYWK